LPVFTYVKIIGMKNLIIGIMIGAAILYWFGPESRISENASTTTEQKIASYYADATATLVSPHNLRERMSHGKEDYVLVDVRAQTDYERGHIVTAINIDTGTGAEKTTDDVLAEFKQVIADNPEKEIIMYCYSAACMNGRKVGNFLAENGVFVKEMTVGWNEWRYGWETWNYDTEWSSFQVEDFIATGTEPGAVPLSAKSIAPCGIEGELSC